MQFTSTKHLYSANVFLGFAMIQFFRKHLYTLEPLDLLDWQNFLSGFFCSAISLFNSLRNVPNRVRFTKNAEYADCPTTAKPRLRFGQAFSTHDSAQTSDIANLVSLLSNLKYICQNVFRFVRLWSCSFSDNQLRCLQWCAPVAWSSDARYW